MKILVIALVFLTQLLNGQNCSKWVLGYLPTYHQSYNGDVNGLNEYDFSRLTHIGHHGPYLNADGSLDYNANGMTPEKIVGAVQACHTNNKPILLSVVSWVSYMDALSTQENRTRCVNELLYLLDTYGYDGIDVDLEPVMSPYIAGMQTDNPTYYAFVSQLYDSLSVRYNSLLGRQPLLTCATNSYGAPVLKQLENKLDMMNIMTYDMTNGWTDYNNFTWHDAPIHDYGNNLPCVQSMVNEMLQHGIASEKIGIGVSFDAFRWKGGSGTPTGGVTAPMQYYTTTPSWTRFSYQEMMDNVYDANFYRWDNVAKMSYLSIDRANDADDEFWSYNDEISCSEKSQFVLNNNLGGLILWELYLGMRNNLPSTNHIPQLTATYNVLCPTYIKQEQIENINISPNVLSKGQSINIRLNQNEKVKIKLFDIMGNIWFNEELMPEYEILSIDITKNVNASGMYFIQIENNTFKKNEKIIILWNK